MKTDYRVIRLLARDLTTIAYPVDVYTVHRYREAAYANVQHGKVHVWDKDHKLLARFFPDSAIRIRRLQ